MTTDTRRILEISAYPPPRAGWSVRVEFLKKQLELGGHQCVVLNIGPSRFTPSPHYETVASGFDYVRKVWRFSRQGFRVHAHINGDSVKGVVLALIAAFLNLAAGLRCALTFHAGVSQIFFPREKSRLMRPMFQLAFALPSQIICNSDAVKELIVAYGVRPEKVTPIPAFSRQYLMYTDAALPEPLDGFYRRYPTILFAYIRARPGFDLMTLAGGFSRLARTHHDIGLLLVGLTEDIDQQLWEAFLGRIRTEEHTDRICVIDELDHDQFRSALKRASIYVRTPVTDGASSSVLESLAMGVPVVAAENGTRPAGVITYQPGDPVTLARVLESTLAARERIARELPHPAIRDTLADEVRLLTEE